MPDTPTDDQPGFFATKPEHCFACYRLIRPGQTCYLTIEQEVLCRDCALVEEVIRVRRPGRRGQAGLPSPLHDTPRTPRLLKYADVGSTLHQVRFAVPG
jgi:hypothetical protein